MFQTLLSIEVSGHLLLSLIEEYEEKMSMITSGSAYKKVCDCQLCLWSIQVYS